VDAGNKEVFGTSLNPGWNYREGRKVLENDEMMILYGYFLPSLASE
jgi:hypothetical protein